jgi:hypothetical protein
LKYADHVYVKLALIKQHAIISIEDDDPGIAEEEYLESHLSIMLQFNLK